MLGYVGATVVEPACLRLPVARDAVGQDGLVTDPGARDGLAQACQHLLRHLGAAAD